MAEDLGSLYAWAHLIGRFLFALAFLASGLAHWQQLDALAGVAARRGIPAAKVVTAISGALILVAGLSILLGWHRFIGAGLLVLFLIGRAFIIHAFWKESDPAIREGERTHFLKDLGLAGAALFIAYHAGQNWPFSIGG